MTDKRDSELPTYRKAMIQVVAYRRIRAVINGVLELFNLNTSQWIILGMLYESATGLRMTDIARSLEVEMPLITRLSRHLRTAGLITSVVEEQDKRAKSLRLTARGLRMIANVERELARRTRRLEKGMSEGEVDNYFRTLGRFMDNSEEPAGE